MTPEPIAFPDRTCAAAIKQVHNLLLPLLVGRCRTTIRMVVKLARTVIQQLALVVGATTTNAESKPCLPFE